MTITAKQSKRADQVIATLKAFKRGETIQEKGKGTGGKWRDFDLWERMDDNAVQYRPKPKRGRK